MTYTINGKEYSEFCIKIRCAELMGIELNQAIIDIDGLCVTVPPEGYLRVIYNPVENIDHTWSIIEKCWDELFSAYGFTTKWESLIKKHSCTKLIAACICFIEIN